MNNPAIKNTAGFFIIKDSVLTINGTVTPFKLKFTATMVAITIMNRKPMKNKVLVILLFLGDSTLVKTISWESNTPRLVQNNGTTPKPSQYKKFVLPESYIKEPLL